MLVLPLSLSATDVHDHGPHKLPEVPQTTEGAWSTLQQHFSKVKQAVADGDHDTIHNSEPVIQACLKVLGQKSDRVEEKNQQRLQGALRQASKAGATLHHAGDAGDRKAMEKGLKQLEGILKVIAAQYPDGVLSAD